MRDPSLTQEYLKSILNYDPETGIFTWKIKPCKKVRAGSVAGSRRSDGRLLIGINSLNYFQHQLAIFITNGRWCDNVIHVNENPSDNRFSNLKELNPMKVNISDKIIVNKKNNGHENVYELMAVFGFNQGVR